MNHRPLTLFCFLTLGACTIPGATDKDDPEETGDGGGNAGDGGGEDAVAARRQPRLAPASLVWQSYGDWQVGTSDGTTAVGPVPGSDGDAAAPDARTDSAYCRRDFREPPVLRPFSRVERRRAGLAPPEVIPRIPENFPPCTTVLNFALPVRPRGS